MTNGTAMGRPVEILLVEDSPTDAELAKEAIGENSLPTRLHHVEDGEAAMSFLRQEGIYATAPRPDMILLDLNLPKKDGREVLAEIRSDPQLKSLLVVVLTTSQDESDILAAYRLNANSYIAKPVDFHKFIYVIKSVMTFFFAVASFPSGPLSTIES